jgi:hypothetical protein
VTNTMIGKVIFPAEPDAELVLNDDLTWSCPDLPEIAASANVLWPPGRISPAHGEPGHLWLREAARTLGGTAHIEPKSPTPLPPGAAY